MTSVAVPIGPVRAVTVSLVFALIIGRRARFRCAVLLISRSARSARSRRSGLFRAFGGGTFGSLFVFQRFVPHFLAIAFVFVFIAIGAIARAVTFSVLFLMFVFVFVFVFIALTIAIAITFPVTLFVFRLFRFIGVGSRRRHRCGSGARASRRVHRRGVGLLGHWSRWHNMAEETRQRARSTKITGNATNRAEKCVPVLRKI
jgi:hypothetical protein